MEGSSSTSSNSSSLCSGCQFDFLEFNSKFYNKDLDSVRFFRDHSVLPLEVKCPRCDSQCVFREDQGIWRCCSSVKVPKIKKRKLCGFSVSERTGTFLERCRIAPWKLLLFINHFLHQYWDHRLPIKSLKFSPKISVDWRSCCSEVTDYWFSEKL